MRSRRLYPILAVVAAGVAIAGTYAYLTSSNGGDPCAGPNSVFANSTVAPAGRASLAPGPSPPRPLGASEGSRVHASGPVLRVVAGENFWGSLVAELGGNDTSVLSIVTDPNADPHEYEANTSDAVAVAEAQYIVENGVGYDTWLEQLVAADGQTHQVVLNVGDLNGVRVDAGVVAGNPHMWYNPVYVNATLAAMFSNLTSLDPTQEAYFSANYASLNASLGAVYGRASLIGREFAGAVVAATESIFVYLANFTHLDLVSPPAFMQAVAEGNDPPADSVVAFQCQLESGHVRVLVYNEQTVTPVTSSMEAIAAAHHVALVGITEIIQPTGLSFPAWMGGEIAALQNALAAAPPGG
jgi:zinc/manganese transport system substrate-binding protein